MSETNPNLGPQWHPNFYKSRLGPSNGGHDRKNLVPSRLADFHPVNDDGIPVIQHDARHDGRPAAWQSRAELN